MGKWVCKTADDYRNAIEQLKQKVQLVGVSATREVNKTLIDGALNILGDAMDRAPRVTGHMASQSQMVINGTMVKAPGGASATAEGTNQFHDAEKLEISVGWEGPLSDVTKDGNQYNIAFVQHEHIEFDHQNGEAKFLETAVDGTMPWLKKQLREAVKRGVENAGD